MMNDTVKFEPDFPPPRKQLVVDLGLYEGPVDLLLQLARDQKVDLLQISILKLAEQYLRFIQEAKGLELEVAADYLVMAAWLAYLKSRLLLPKDEALPEDGPSPEAMAAALAQRLQRLAVLQEAAKELLSRPRLGIERFARGRPEALPENVTSRPMTDITELLQAYAGIQRRTRGRSLSIRRSNLHTVEAAITRLTAMLGVGMDWQAMEIFLPLLTGDPIMRRSGWASTFAASLQLSKEGKLSIRQDALFAPIYLRAHENARTDD